MRIGSNGREQWERRRSLLNEVGSLKEKGKVSIELGDSSVTY